MCFSKEISLKAFIICVLSSLLLITTTKINKVLGIFYIFVGLMQLIEYFAWNDLNGEKGQNKIISLLGPLLNHFQPVILYLLLKKYISGNYNLEIINILYIIYSIERYYNYINNTELLTTVNNDGHLYWKWKENFNYNYYHLYMFLIIINYSQYNTLIISTIISYILFGISYLKYSKNIGELWCFGVNGIPLIIYLFQKYYLNN